jgi:hypothetical protein
MPIKSAFERQCKFFRGDRSKGIYPLLCPSPFLCTAAAVFVAVKEAYRSPFSRALELNCMSLFAFVAPRSFGALKL